MKKRVPPDAVEQRQKKAVAKWTVTEQALVDQVRATVAEVARLAELRGAQAERDAMRRFIATRRYLTDATKATMREWLDGRNERYNAHRGGLQAKRRSK